MSYEPLIVGLIAAAAVFTIFAGLIKRQPQVNLLDARLAVYDEPTAPRTLDEIEMSQPFTERFLRPFFERIGRRVTSMQPRDRAQKLQILIDLAGRPLGMNAGSFVAAQLVLAVVVGVVGLGLAVLLGFPWFLGLIFGAVLGYIGPQYQLKRIVTSRQKEISLALPNALDLLCISVEAGLGFDAALARVIEKFDNALSREFAFVLNEIRLGRPRHEALEDLGKRSGVQELASFIQALVQSDQLGVGIARVLRIQADEMRRRRRQKAEAKAQQASLKMLFPMVGCIFPVLFVILLGPPAIHLLFPAVGP
ncbi:MAG TPA: type II secretion system F family protein [Candidatus Dormibacteraeota bacterium]|nr:type II secretion system F family protein [Candidatus Dormibacteraeota bacterium]